MHEPLPSVFDVSISRNELRGHYEDTSTNYCLRKGNMDNESVTRRLIGQIIENDDKTVKTSLRCDTVNFDYSKNFIQDAPNFVVYTLHPDVTNKN